MKKSHLLLLFTLLALPSGPFASQKSKLVEMRQQYRMAKAALFRNDTKTYQQFDRIAPKNKTKSTGRICPAKAAKIIMPNNTLKYKSIN